MDALPNDIQQYICGKVDKKEHVIGLVDGMTASEKANIIAHIMVGMDGEQMMVMELIYREVIREKRTNSYNQMRDEWKKMQKHNKKNGTNRSMYVHFKKLYGKTMGGSDILVKVEKFGRNTMYCMTMRAETRVGDAEAEVRWFNGMKIEELEQVSGYGFELSDMP
jgi:hypothetical protein